MASVLTFAGDTNTGLFRVSADRYAFSANGQIAAFVYSTGGVGRLGVNDTDQSHCLAFSAEGILSADRVLTITTGSDPDGDTLRQSDCRWCDYD